MVAALALLACSVAFATAAPTANAAAPADPDATPGPTEYEAGITAYNLAHFDEAAGHFEKAYQADHAPILLFNIAQCHRKSGDDEKAIFFYRRYLDEDPGTAKRAEVEGRIADLRARLAASHPAAPPPEARAVTAPAPAIATPPAAPLTPAAPRPEAVPAAPAAEVSPRPRVLPWATLAASTLVVAFGVYETTRWAGAASDFDGLRDPATTKGLCGASDPGHGADARCAGLYSDMTTARGLALGSLGVGAALGIASAILFHRAPDPAARMAQGGSAPLATREPALSCGPSGARLGLACVARF